jgi:hypothetical protein
MEQVKVFFKNTKTKKAIKILGCFVVALLIFQAGMVTGFKKASFSFKTGEQYFRQMSGKPNDRFMGINRNDFVNSHGAVGKIVSTQLPSIVITDRDGIEKTILISTSTMIKEAKETVKDTDLQIDEFVTVIGNPNNKAEIEAKLIRIMPNPEQMPFNQIPQGEPNN